MCNEARGREKKGEAQQKEKRANRVERAIEPHTASRFLIGLFGSISVPSSSLHTDKWRLLYVIVHMRLDGTRLE